MTMRNNRIQMLLRKVVQFEVSEVKRPVVAVRTEEDVILLQVAN